MITKLNLQQKIVACQSEFAKLMLKKNMSVDFGRGSKFKYFEVGFLLKNLNPILAKHNLMMTFSSSEKDVVINGAHVLFSMYLLLTNADNPSEKISFATPAGGTVGREMGQTLGKVTTYAMRVLLQMVFLTHEADDLEQYTLDQQKQPAPAPKLTGPQQVQKQIGFVDKLGD